MKTLLIFLAVALFITGIVLAVPKSIDRQHQVDCYKWQKWEEQQLGDFRISNEMRHDCKTVGVEI